MNASTKVLLALAGAGLVAWQIERRVHRYTFRHKVVAISGGSRGLGLAMARALAKEGARLALIGRSVESLEAARRELEGDGASVEVFECDVRRREQVKQAFAGIEAAYGRLDALINNAGTILCAPFDNHTDEDFEKAIGTHIMGPLYTIREALPLMRRQGAGRILNVSSIGGKVGVPHMSAYSASKYGLVGLSRSLAAELRRENIRVTVACPGLMRTGSQRVARFRGQHEKEYSWFSALQDHSALSLPVEKAARRMIEACRSGRPEVIFPARWWLAATGDELLPSLSVKANDWVNRLLPDPVSHPSATQRGLVAGLGQEPERLRDAAAAMNQP